ncbi:MAG TPA: erythromycin esterase family protein, partial [Dongiaceae bacterium]|nr:erythromycin esterase family protein [Dongiaceae bacterium]
MKIRPWLLAAAVIACAVPAIGADKRAVAVDWVRRTAIPLTSVEAGHGFEDLQPLKKIVGDARLVSLGEATHGSREIFQLKHRMIEFLATEMGFTIFAIEANMPEAYRLNDYVLKGEGDPAALLKGMYFWTWDTEEVLAMIRWMREFNQSGKGRIEFTGFDMQFPAVAAGIVSTFVAEQDATYAPTLGKASALASAVASPASQGRAALAVGKFPFEAAAGKKVHFSGYIRTREVTGGWAGLWWRVDGKNGILAFDNMQDRGATGTTDWKRYDLELPVSPDVTNISFGLLMPGSGTAWFDDLSITLDGTPFVEPEGFDLGFESETPLGFWTGGSGYEVRLDAEVAHGGKQSLRMTRVVTAEAPEADPAAASAQWKEVVSHLEAGRTGYAARGAAANDIEWAVQNARVVLQSMQMKSGEVDRDRSMAENVAWILDHNPGRKVVLWAHDGHVARKGYRDDSM